MIEEDNPQRKAGPRGSYKFFARGMDVLASAADYEVEQAHKKKLTMFDKLLKV
jgi:hypothetical protein